MGNANGREEGGNIGEAVVENGSSLGRGESGIPVPPSSHGGGGGGVPSSDSMGNNAFSPPHSPVRAASPLLFAPQVPITALQNADPFSNWWNNSHGAVGHPPGQGIPTIIIWSLGGNEVAVEGSWDNWASRKRLQRSGKDHSILMVLPSGIYHYRFIVDGMWRYIPDLPYVADEEGHVCNVLDVHDYVPENLDSVTEFEAPLSPDSTYSQAFPAEEDYAKDPVAVPPQLHLSVLDMENSNEASSSRPQHVVLNHLFIEKGWASQSLVALGLTHRFQSKFVTVVLYKPVKR